MPKLIRRRIADRHRTTWHVYYADVRVGAIGERAGVPVHVDQCGWSCGFYPGLEPNQHKSGAAATFDAARAAFEQAWQQMLPNIPEGAFDEYRRHHALQRWKESMWAAGLPLPTQVAGGRAQCYCGAAIEIRSVGPHVDAEHMT
jgi:hypothetical protein